MRFAGRKGSMAGEISLVGFLVLLVVLVIAGGMWGCPQYTVYQQRLKGEAELARASQNRQIKVQEAMAKKEAAKLEGEAEVSRAAGLAEANRVIGQSLGGEHGERYLRYLWIIGMEKATHETIYIPTEAGLPILEANRRKVPPSIPAAAVEK